jgi:hypothetical protein
VNESSISQLTAKLSPNFDLYVLSTADYKKDEFIVLNACKAKQIVIVTA